MYPITYPLETQVIVEQDDTNPNEVTYDLDNDNVIIDSNEIIPKKKNSKNRTKVVSRNVSNQRNRSFR